MAKGDHNKLRTHCRTASHPLTDDNVEMHGPDKKWRRCRECSRTSKRNRPRISRAKKIDPSTGRRVPLEPLLPRAEAEKALARETWLRSRRERA